MNGSDIGEIVRSARKYAGYSQRQLENAAGVPRGSVNYIEHGRHSPNVDTVLKIMRACDWEIVFKPKYRAMQRRK